MLGIILAVKYLDIKRVDGEYRAKQRREQS